MNKKKWLVMIVITILLLFFVPNALNRIRFGIEKLTGNINMCLEVEGLGITKIANGYPDVDTVYIDGDTINITKSQIQVAEEVYIHGLVANSFDTPELILNGMNYSSNARMNNQQIFSAFRFPTYIMRGFAFDLDVNKLRLKNEITIRCNGKEQKCFLLLND